MSATTSGPASGRSFSCRTNDKAQPLYRFCRGIPPGVEEAKAFIEQIKAEFQDARHNCWAYCAGAAEYTDRIGASDDGEPHGTAGRPMLTAVTHSGIGEVTVVVTRYFGGILLGTGGLVKAYQSSVKMALEAVPTRIRTSKRNASNSALNIDL